MRKLLRITLFNAVALLLVFQVLQAQNIDKIYLNMPDRLLPVLNKQKRLELVEYFKAGQTDTVKNNFGGISEITLLDTLQQRIVVENTASSRFEMKLVKSAERPFIAVIRTVCADSCLSNVECYDTLWTRLPDRVDLPATKDWITDNASAEGKLTSDDVSEIYSANVYALAFTGSGDDLMVRNNTSFLLTDEDKKAVAPYLKTRQSIVLKFNGKRWSKE